MNCDNCKVHFPQFQNSITSFPSLSCSHTICGQCIALSLIKSKFTFKNIDSIPLTCPTCTQGTTSLPITTIKQLLSLKSSINLCKQHFIPIESYCTDCKIPLCSQCKQSFHDIHFSSHQLTKPFVMCNTHNKPLTLFCTKCNSEICNECKCNQEHVESITNASEVVSKQRNEIVNDLMFKFFDEWNEKIVDMRNQMVGLVERREKVLNENIDNVINKLNEVKKIISQKKEDEIKRKNELFTLIHECFAMYYNELLKDNLSVTELNLLKQIDVSFENCEFTENDKESIFKQIEKCTKDICNDNDELINCDFVFKQLELNSIIQNDEKPEEPTSEIVTTNPEPEPETTNNETTVTSNTNKEDEVKEEINETIENENNENIQHEETKEEPIQPSVSTIELENDTPITKQPKEQIEPSPQLKHSLQTPHKEFLTCSAKTDNEYIVTAGTEKTVYLYKKNETTNNYELSPQTITSDDITSSIRSICILKESSTLILGTSNGEIYCYFYPDFDFINSFTANSEHMCIRHIFQLNEESFLTSGDDSKICIWNLNNYECEYSLEGHTQSINSVIVLKSINNRLVSASEDGTLILWNTTKSMRGKCFTFTGHEGGVMCLCELTGGRVISGGKDGRIKFWDCKNENCRNTFEKAHDDWVCCLCDLTDGLLASGGRDNVIKIWNLRKSECISVYKGHMNTILDLYAEKDNDNLPTPNKLISISADNTINTWEI